MVKAFWFLLAVVGCMALALWVLNRTSGASFGFKDASDDPMCAQFLDARLSEAGAELGYKGRVKQLLYGCI